MVNELALSMPGFCLGKDMVEYKTMSLWCVDCLVKVGNQRGFIIFFQWECDQLAHNVGNVNELM